MRHTPLYGEHSNLGAKIIDFSGWALPVQFAGILEEHAHTRQKASLFDCSHMGEFLLQGADAINAYNRLVTTDVTRVKIGRAKYGALLNNQAGIIDDLITMRLSEEEFLVVTNAGPLERVSGILQKNVPNLTDISQKTAKIDVQGPKSREILTVLGFEAAERLSYFGLERMQWRGESIVISRTGYTGELGFELYIPNELAVELWQMLLEQPQVKPAGLGARDTLRLEMGYPLYGQDLNESITPLEAGEDRFVAWDSGFTGCEALLAQREAGGYQKLTPIRTNSRQAPRHDFEVYNGDALAGIITSGTFGPSVGHGIGLAYLSEDAAVPGKALTAGKRRLEIEVTDLPFYTNGTCRD